MNVCLAYFIVNELIVFPWYEFSDEFVAMFREKTGYPIVEPAHMVIVVLVDFSCLNII